VPCIQIVTKGSRFLQHASVSLDEAGRESGATRVVTMKKSLEWGQWIESETKRKGWTPQSLNSSVLGVDTGHFD
jgi:hypothetical protein